MAEDLATAALRECGRLGAQYAEFRHERVRASGYSLKNGVVESSEETASEGISVRVVSHGGSGFASSNNISRKTALEAARRAFQLARSAGRANKEPIRFTNEASYVVSYEVRQKRPLGDLSSQDRIEYLKSLDKAALDSKVSLPMRYLAVGDWTKEKYLENTDGTKVKSTIPRVHLFYAIAAMEGGASQQFMFQFGNAGGWEFTERWGVRERIAEQAKTLKRVLTKAKPAPTDPVDIVVGPYVSGIASHESCGHPSEADRIMGREAAQAGESFIELSMLGSWIGSEEATVIDDPSLPNSYGHYLFDDEGVKTGPRALYQSGRINTLLHNRQTAHKVGLEHSNGSSRAEGYDDEPIIRMGNTYVAPGDHTFEELVEDVKDGVYIRDFMEWNIDDKRYNQKYVGTEAYRILNGEVQEAIKNPVLELTTPAFWSAIDARAKDVEYFAATCGKGDPMQGAPVHMGGPHMRLRNIRLGGAKK
jgi:TldD protein